jgi:histidine triad (HIT) family protein
MVNSECIFCKIVNGDIPATKVYEDEISVAFEDVNPAAPLHLLVIPKKHISTLNDATAEDSTILGALMHTAASVAKASPLCKNGYRVVTNVDEDGGQTVFHIHLHVLGGRAMNWPPG